MAEQGNTTALVPVQGEYMMTVKEFDASGKSTELSAPMPANANFKQWSMMQQAIMLKKGIMKSLPVQEVVFAITYAEGLGLDIMAGDVFSTGDGRIGVSNKAKIKRAMSTKLIEGIEVEIRDTGEAIALAGCSQKTDLECTAKIHVKDWKMPIVRKSRLSRWYKPKNPNWAGNPEHMLELNTVAHAMEYINPMATTEGDEAPPLTT